MLFPLYNVLPPVYDMKINIKRNMKTYWKVVLLFGILMMNLYLLMAFLFKENDEEKFKETDPLGWYEIMQLIICTLIQNSIAFKYFD